MPSFESVLSTSASCLHECYQWVLLAAISRQSKKASLFKRGLQNQAGNQDVEQYARELCLM